MVSARQILPILFLALAACTQPEENRLCCAAPEPPTAQDRVASLWTPETRTVLTGDQARALSHQCSRVSPGPVTDIWTPSEDDLNTLEDVLIAQLARELEQRGESPSPGGYYRQYAGFVIGGKQIIYVNGVDESVIERDLAPPSSDPNAIVINFDWRTQATQICDGGAITFGVEYDPSTGRFSNFAFNGPG